MSSLLRRLLRRWRDRPLAPGAGYDLWSATYDAQDDNPVMIAEGLIFDRLLEQQDLSGKTVVDVGCGTGRHWPRVMARHPARLVGYEASSGMRARLTAKFPDAETHFTSDHRLAATPDRTCDLLLSSLTLGYLPDLDAVLDEWCRVLRPRGEIIVTDLHPGIAAGGTRGFRVGERDVRIRHFVHPIAAVLLRARRRGLTPLRAEEGLVDDSVRPAYEAKGARVAYEQMTGQPLVYGFRFRGSGD